MTPVDALAALFVGLYVVLPAAMLATFAWVLLQEWRP
jgi:hypothetical protein